MDVSLKGQLDLGVSRSEGTLTQNLVRQSKREQDREKIAELSKDFESIFLQIVLKSMRGTVNKSGLMDGGNAEDIYQSMLDSEYSKVMSRTGSTGLSDAIERQLLDIAGLKNEAKDLTNKVNGQKLYAAQALQTPTKQATMVVGKGLPPDSMKR